MYENLSITLEHMQFIFQEQGADGNDEAEAEEAEAEVEEAEAEEAEAEAEEAEEVQGEAPVLEGEHLVEEPAPIAAPAIELQGLGAAHQAMLQGGGPTGFQPYKQPQYFNTKVSCC